MRSLFVVMMVVVAVMGEEKARVRHGFYREIAGPGVKGGEGELSTRRVFGGEPAELKIFPSVCALLDRYWSIRCSAAVVSPRWALTAAHCVSPKIAYVKYNTRRPSASDGDVAPVHYLYRHPGYKVLQEDEGRGMDVTLLHHDVGLVRTRVDMVLRAGGTTFVPHAPLHSMRLYNPVDLQNEEVQVLGFGRTDRTMLNEELFAVRLKLVFCERGAWFHCLCGVAAGRDPRGVCSGDSGGPVVFNGAQIGVTSMGPMECSPLATSLGHTGLRNSTGALLDGPPSGATSVFTSLYNYADLVNATIYDTEQVMRMRMIGNAPRQRCSSLAFAPLLLPLLMPAR